jgi:roadblock/LC7 domain-containing protein
MKKVFSIFLVLILTLAVLAGCSSPSTPSNETPAADTPSNDTGNDTGIVKMGLGHITSIAKSKDLGVDKDGKEVLPVGQVDTVIAAVAFDKDGKVVKVTIDNAQTKVNFDKNLQVTSDLAANYKTKVELGDEYGMIKASSIKKNWYEQIAELEKWMIGKTVDEIKAMKVKQRDESHPAVPDVPELTSLVTITVQDYIEAVAEAYENAVEVQGGAVELGLGHKVSIGKSKGYSVKDGKETLPVAQVDTVMAATAFDKDGKVVRTIIDNAQTKVEFSKEGKVTTDKNGVFKTKVELGDEYGMIKASSIKKNWYEQIAELEKWMIGKTVDEIKAMKVKQRDESHPAVPDVPELTSLVTITVQDYIEAVAESYENAK